MKKISLFKRIFSLCMMSVLLLAGCTSSSNVFEAAFCAPMLDANLVDDTGAALTEALPEIRIEGQEPVFSYVFAGSIPDDPMSGAAGQTRITGMLMAQELDVIIATPEVARVQAVNELFMPLSELFSPQELDMLAGRTIKYEFVDVMNGQEVPTGKYTEECGIDITGHEHLTSLLGDQKLGVYVAANTDHPEQAKALIRYLAGY